MLNQNLVSTVGTLLSTISQPMNPWIVWEMNPEKCPVNSFEAYFFIMLTTLGLYIVVSMLTVKEPFNLERLLHRGIYNLDGGKAVKFTWGWRNFFHLLGGITDDYSRSDKCLAWSLLFFSYGYQFAFCFVLQVAWNAISPWPLEWWSTYFLITNILVPAVLALITSVWFGIGGVIGIRQLFRDLESRTADPLDNGMVSDGVATSDAIRFVEIEEEHENQK